MNEVRKEYGTARRGDTAAEDSLERENARWASVDGVRSVDMSSWTASRERTRMASKRES